MTCDVYEEQASALIDNELRDEEAEELFRHLSACTACRESFRAALDLRSGLRETVPPMAPREMDEKVLSLVPAARRYVVDRKALTGLVWNRRISLPLPVAVTVAVILVGGSLALSSMWSMKENQASGARIQTVYMTTLPAVEVQGRYIQPKTTIQ